MLGKVVQHCLVEGPVVHVKGEPRDAAVVVRLGLTAQSNILAQSAVHCSAVSAVGYHIGPVGVGLGVGEGETVQVEQPVLLVRSQLPQSQYQILQ